MGRGECQLKCRRHDSTFINPDTVIDLGKDCVKACWGQDIHKTSECRPTDVIPQLPKRERAISMDRGYHHLDQAIEFTMNHSRRN